MPDLDSRYENQKQIINELLLTATTEALDDNDFHHRLRMYPYKKLKKFLGSLGESLDNKSVAVLGCGKGDDFHLINKFFNNVKLAGVDISEVGLGLVRSTFPEIETVIGNMEALDFEDETFDYAIIPVALHHVQSVYRGVYEAVRISRKGAILLEPYDSLLARIATRLGLATEYEQAGNYVFRVSIREMVKVGKAMFTMVHTQPYMCIHYTAKSPIDFAVWRGINMIADLVAPWAANECIVYFRKQVRLGPKNV
jgi:ubiquinone/menaquinone biosynthesis C-methylase UbiE